MKLYLTDGAAVCVVIFAVVGLAAFLESLIPIAKWMYKAWIK